MRRNSAPSNNNAGSGTAGNMTGSNRGNRWNPYRRGGWNRNRGGNNVTNNQPNTTNANNSIPRPSSSSDPIRLESFMIDADTGPYTGWRLYFPQTGIKNQII